jgi:GT2 family glycosyltransferase
MAVLYQNDPDIGEIDSDTLIIIENNENLGFAKGNNVGIRLAEIMGSEWVFLLNNDTVISKDSLSRLYEHINTDPGISAITPQIRYFNTPEMIWNCGGKLTCFGSRKYFYSGSHYKKAPEKGSREITFITGCALLFKFRETGILSEKYFFGEEDYEFSLRLQKRGLKMICAFDSVIYHKVGRSIKKRSNIKTLIYIQLISRLINTRDYYSYVRWTCTKLLYFIYLPFLLAKSGSNPVDSIRLTRKVDHYVRNNTAVGKSEYQFDK